MQLIPGCVSKQYLDRLVMNLLIVEGRKEAAKAFAQESGIEGTSLLPGLFLHFPHLLLRGTFTQPYGYSVLGP